MLDYEVLKRYNYKLEENLELKLDFLKNKIIYLRDGIKTPSNDIELICFKSNISSIEELDITTQIIEEFLINNLIKSITNYQNKAIEMRVENKIINLEEMSIDKKQVMYKKIGLIIEVLNKNKLEINEKRKKIFNNKLNNLY